MFQHSEPVVQERLRSSRLVCVAITLVGGAQRWCAGQDLPRGWDKQRRPAACRLEEEGIRSADRSRKEGPDDFVPPSSVPYCVLHVFSMSYP